MIYLAAIEANANISLESLLRMLEVMIINILQQETITEMDRSIKNKKGGRDKRCLY